METRDIEKRQVFDLPKVHIELTEPNSRVQVLSALWRNQEDRLSRRHHSNPTVWSLEIKAQATPCAIHKW